MVHATPAAITRNARLPTTTAISGDTILTQPLEVLPLDERCQEPLRQVARIFRVETSAAEVGVERIPVGLAE
jgi:hypothetical protein